MLVLTDTSSECPEAYPCQTNKAREVTKILLQEIIPSFGVLGVISLDQGPHFIAEVVHQISTLLGIDWQLHTPYRLQSSGQMEKMNHQIKLQIVKVSQEAWIPWPQALPWALLRIRTKPQANEVCMRFFMGSHMLYRKRFPCKWGTKQ